MEYKEILDFWFEELNDDGRFNGGEDMDRKISERFSDVHAAAAAGALKNWRTTAEGALAEIIVLDQFSRNLYRGTSKAFDFDERALRLAVTAIECGYDQKLSVEQRLFIYMPYMHSEDALVHETALVLFEDLGLEGPLKYEKIHKEIIDQFGRYPHRNKQLGRENTPEEDMYLQDTEHSFFKS